MNKFVRTAAALVLIFGGFGIAFGLAAAGNPIGGGATLIGGCLLGAFVCP